MVDRVKLVVGPYRKDLSSERLETLYRECVDLGLEANDAVTVDASRVRDLCARLASFILTTRLLRDDCDELVKQLEQRGVSVLCQREGTKPPTD